LTLYTTDRPAVISIDDPTFKVVGDHAYLHAPFDRNTIMNNSFSSTPSTASLHFPSAAFSDVEGELTRFARTPGSIDIKAKGVITRIEDTVFVVSNGSVWTFDGDDESLAIQYTEPSLAWQTRSHIRALSKDKDQIENIQYALQPSTLSAMISCTLSDRSIHVHAMIVNNASYDINNIGELTVRHWPQPQPQVYAEEAPVLHFEQARSKASSSRASFSTPITTHTASPYEVEVPGTNIPSIKRNSTTVVPVKSLSVTKIEWMAYFSDVEYNHYSLQKALLTLSEETSLPDLPCTLTAHGQRALIRFSQKVNKNKTPLDVLDSNPMVFVESFRESSDSQTASIRECTVTLKVLERDSSKLQNIVLSVNGLQKIVSVTKDIRAEEKKASSLFSSPSRGQSLLSLTSAKWPSQITIRYTQVQ